MFGVLEAPKSLFLRWEVPRTQITSSDRAALNSAFHLEESEAQASVVKGPHQDEITHLH